MASARENNAPDFAEIPDPLEGSGDFLTHEVNQRALRGGNAGPTRDALARRRRTLLLASVVWLLTLLAGFGVRVDFGRLPTTQLLWMELVPLLGVVGCAAIALAPGALGLGMRAKVLVGVGLVGLLVPAAFSLGFFTGDSGGGLELHFKCFGLVFGAALLPLLFFGLWLPRTVVARPRLRGALLGVAAGLFGVVLVNLHCASNSPVHVGFAHHAPSLVLALFAAAWLGHRVRV